MNTEKSTKYIMSLGHFCSDFAQGTLAAMLPFLIATYHYNYATAAVLVMVSNIMGSLIQPVFGAIADRFDKPHLMTLGVAMACGGMAVAGLIPNFVGLCFAVVISGTGVAMFHPQGARMVNRTSNEDNIGMNLGIFSFGGNAGFMLGPIVASTAITLAGLKGTLFFFLPAIVFIILMFGLTKGYVPETLNSSADETQQEVAEKRPDRWGNFLTLGVYIICRSIMFSCVGTFVILYFMDAFGVEKTTGSSFLSLFYCVSAISSLVGGKMADVYGQKKTMMFSSVVMAIAGLLFAVCRNLILSVALLIPMGAGISLAYSSMVALGQKYLPNHIGLASGLTLGLSVSIGGVISPLFGVLADNYGLVYIFYVVVIISIISLVTTVILPKE